MNGYTRYLREYLWKLKVPPKIKIFYVVPKQESFTNQG
jgi:hypothetical protein